MLSKGTSAHYEKLQLNERFKTFRISVAGHAIPCWSRSCCRGRGHRQKNASTVMDKSFLGHSMHILDNDMTDRTTNADHLIQEMALKDWMRGGGSAREKPTRRFHDEEVEVSSK
jgi:hypothetical protein